MEQIRQHLNIDRWMLFGGSWGATLSLLYAQTHPERVSGLMLRGVFLCRPQDLNWLYQEGASRIYPDHWQDYLAPVAEADRGDMLTAYYRLLTSENEIARLSAAKAWSIWEGRCSTLDPKADLVEHYGSAHVALAMARIEAHYFINKGFLDTDQLLRDTDKISHIKTTIVHGRYDMVCPLDQAYELYQQLPEAELHIVRNAGHETPGFQPRTS